MVDVAMPIHGEPRIYTVDAGTFIIRDVKEMYASPEGFKTRRLGCEYAINDGQGGSLWKPCGEGVLFSEIEPFEAAA